MIQPTEDTSAREGSSLSMDDTIANQIINQEHTIDSLLDIRTKNFHKLSSLHNVLLFNKISSLFHKEHDTLKKNRVQFDRVEKTLD